MKYYLCVAMLCASSVSCARAPGGASTASASLLDQAMDLFTSIKTAQSSDEAYPDNLNRLSQVSGLDLIKACGDSVSNEPVNFAGNDLTGLKDQLQTLTTDADVTGFYSHHASIGAYFTSASVQNEAVSLAHVQRSLEIVKAEITGGPEATTAERAMALKVSLSLLAAEMGQKSNAKGALALGAITLPTAATIVDMATSTTKVLAAGTAVAVAGKGLVGTYKDMTKAAPAPAQPKMKVTTVTTTNVKKLAGIPICSSETTQVTTIQDCEATSSN